MQQIQQTQQAQQQQHATAQGRQREEGGRVAARWSVGSPPPLRLFRGSHGQTLKNIFHQTKKTTIKRKPFSEIQI